ncbi:MAG: hypothetical protein R6V03_06580 [Kiritimatiellia bacterium]
MRAEGAITEYEGRKYYTISGYDFMRPFLAALVSNCDLWMYVSSRGAPAAGRRNPEGSLFPYETVDRLHDSPAGPLTVIDAGRNGESFRWRPFSESGRERWRLERSMSKSLSGARIRFEEINHTLGMVFSYEWAPSEDFGWVRRAALKNLRETAADIRLLDGLRRILPSGIPVGIQQSKSCLADAYTRNELDESTGLALFTLSSVITDRAEAAESLRAHTAWQAGLPSRRILLSERQVDAFLAGDEPVTEKDTGGVKGAYLAVSGFRLEGTGAKEWVIVLDSDRSQNSAAKLRGRLASEDECLKQLTEDIKQGEKQLLHLLAGADCLQHGADAMAAARHRMNVLFNCGRGGALPGGYVFPVEDFRAYALAKNRPAAVRNSAIIDGMGEKTGIEDLRAAAEAAGDPDFTRLAGEYLPLTFARRHGDPSRPWNHFDIRTREEDGSPRLDYEGNWRDIFQNWEALARSYPEIIESMIARFVNASTMDGFNPFRLTRDSFEWEAADPGDPWSSVGYWGDHQVVYLLKLLELSREHHPGLLEKYLGEEIFCYADVPYDIAPYEDILRDSRNTITLNRQRAAAAGERCVRTGADGKLVHSGDEILRVNLAEKLLVPVLAKFSNLVPEGGIWLNTVRPEWNDANNALVGNGMSVVTVCYLHRHLDFLVDLFGKADFDRVAISGEVIKWFREVGSAVKELADLQDTGALGDKGRRKFMDRVGRAFSKYRKTVYNNTPGEKQKLERSAVVDFLEAARETAHRTVRANRRDDGLYHTYNLLHLAADEASVSRLFLMTEGQVAVLTSGVLSPEEALEVLRSLRASELYDPRRQSYILYPPKDLPRFLDKNIIPPERIGGSRLPGRLLEDGAPRGVPAVVLMDTESRIRFGPEMINADAVEKALDELARRDDWRDDTERERGRVLDIYEAVFSHKSFTGRSGTMFAYEGNGCIYWHMIGKLLLAAQENFLLAVSGKASEETRRGLSESFRDIQAGLGYRKGPSEWGAFVLDAYSHTPADGAARQPGMTGQVKEEILARWGELGVMVENGSVRFNPGLLDPGEFLPGPAVFTYVDVSGAERTLELPDGALAFTLCQVPVVYRRGGEGQIAVSLSSGKEKTISGTALSAELSRELFRRTGAVTRLDVRLPQPSPPAELPSRLQAGRI